ncbi:hypothetical protein ACTXT7_012286 [Hymenolepis weldensis]
MADIYTENERMLETLAVKLIERTHVIRHSSTGHLKCNPNHLRTDLTYSFNMCTCTTNGMDLQPFDPIS